MMRGSRNTPKPLWLGQDTTRHAFYLNLQNSTQNTTPSLLFIPPHIRFLAAQVVMFCRAASITGQVRVIDGGMSGGMR